MGFRIEVLVAREENCEKRRPMREAMLCWREMEDWRTLSSMPNGEIESRE